MRAKKRIIVSQSKGTWSVGALEHWGNSFRVLRGVNAALISCGQIITQDFFCFSPNAPVPQRPNARFLKLSFCSSDYAKGQIEKAYKGFSLTLDTIPGIGIIFAAGIFAEIGDIERFASEAQLARYAGLAWKRSQSGDFTADETPIFRSSNVHLRYYLVEAANSVKNNEPAYKEYYQKKYNEVKKHQHKRALVLTARKLVRLIYALLKKGEIYQSVKV